jgi:hypothetical protein
MYIKIKAYQLYKQNIMQPPFSVHVGHSGMLIVSFLLIMFVLLFLFKFSITNKMTKLSSFS